MQDVLYGDLDGDLSENTLMPNQISTCRHTVRKLAVNSNCVETQNDLIFLSGSIHQDADKNKLQPLALKSTE